MEDYYGFTKDKRANGELKQKTIEVGFNKLSRSPYTFKNMNNR
jgi:hypothetical protein